MIVIGEESHVRNQRLWAHPCAHEREVPRRPAGAYHGEDVRRRPPGGRRDRAGSSEYRTATMSVLRIAFLSSFMLELLSAVSIAIVAVLSGLRLMAGTMHFAPAYFILLAAPEYFLVLRTLGTYYHMRMEAMSAAERITALFATAAPARSPRSLHQAATLAAPDGACSVTFDSVSFSFAARKILDGVSFSIPSGGRVALDRRERHREIHHPQYPSGVSRPSRRTRAH